MDEEQQALLKLHLTPRLGRVALFKLHHYFGDFSTALAAPPQQWREAGISANIAAHVPKETDPHFQRVLNKLSALKVQLK